MSVSKYLCQRAHAKAHQTRRAKFGAVLGRIVGVLPASRSSNPPQSIWNLYRSSILAALVLAGYGLLVGMGLWLGWISRDRAYLLMALPCLAPALWYGYSFFKGSDGALDGARDFGLLLSALGWALLALGFAIKDAVFHNAQATFLSGAADAENAPLATLCFVLGLVSLVAGAALSLSRRE